MTFFISIYILLGFIILNNLQENEFFNYIYVVNFGIFYFFILKWLYKSFLTYLNCINFNTNELNIIFIYLDKIIFNINEYSELTLICLKNIYNITNEFLLSTYNIISEYNYIPLYYIYIVFLISMVIWIKTFRPAVWSTKLDVFIKTGVRLISIYLLIFTIVLIAFLIYKNTSLFSFINIDDLNWKYYYYIFRLCTISLVVYKISFLLLPKAGTKDEFTRYIFGFTMGALIICFINIIFNIFFLDWAIVFINGEESSSGSSSLGNNPGGGTPQPPKGPDYSSILWKNNSEGSSSKSNVTLTNDSEGSSSKSNVTSTSNPDESNNQNQSDNSRKRTAEEANLTNDAGNNRNNPNIRKQDPEFNKNVTILQIIEDDCVRRIREIHPEVAGVKKEIETMQGYIDKVPGGLASLAANINYGGFGHGHGYGNNNSLSSLIGYSSSTQPLLSNLTPRTTIDSWEESQPGFQPSNKPGDPPFMRVNGTRSFNPNTLEGIYNLRAGTTIEEEYNLKIARRVHLERESNEWRRLSRNIRLAIPDKVDINRSYLPLTNDQ